MSKQICTIAHVQVIPKLSGAQLFSFEILKNTLADRKYIICSSSEIVDNKQKEDFIRQFNSIDVEIIWVKHLKRSIGLHDILVFPELYHIFKKYNFDIIHTNSTKPGFVARITARLAGIKKIIHTVHGIAFHKHTSFITRLLFYIIEIISLQFGHYNVTVNKFYLKYYKFFPWKKSISIYNGIDFTKLQNNQIHSRSEIVKLLFVGRLDKQKDPLTLIKAFYLCKKKHNEISLNIVGDGDLFDDCVNLVNALGLNDSVVMYGWSGSTSEFYNNSDIFISPSIFEAFGFTLTEAAYYKLPIIATNVEGIPEVVIDEKMGFLTEPKDINRISDKIIYLIENPEIAVNMGEYGHTYVTKNFPIEKMINQYNALYHTFED
ncbi:glycosyltransferase family 4 protein [Morganella psychrotolerans]|uniref:glycosyltransferase family 4 protein n=1 Tax=Morganella psychrotolerans TaxID=368603 RepID=UPI0039AEED89